jgi:hypothetical protein
MRPTRVPALLLALLVAGACGYVLTETAYSSIPPLPVFAPVGLLLLAVVELGMARIIRGKIRRTRPGGRPLHPMQVARGAVLAKASSLGGALVAGLYGGIFLWTFGRRDQLATYSDDARVAGLSALAALLLVVAALLLERACRTPDDPPRLTP